MSIFESSPSPWTGRMLSVLRIVTGAVFMLHGTMKMFDVPAGQQHMPPYVLMSQMGFAGILEGFGGACILVGLATRPVAFLLAGEMAVAYFQMHFPRSFFPPISGGEPAALYCFIYLYLMLAGAGPWSIDAMIASRKTMAP
jgi:putative oxidoreductase